MRPREQWLVKDEILLFFLNFKTFSLKVLKHLMRKVC